MTDEIDLGIGEKSGLRTFGVGEILETPKLPVVRLRTFGVGIFSDADAEAASDADIVLSGSPRDLVCRAAAGMRDMSRIYLATGYALLKAKSEIDEGQFKQFLDEAGIPEQRAYEAISAAKLFTRATPEQRKALCSIGKVKTTLLAAAEPEVVEALLEDDNLMLDGLSVRQLRTKIRSLEAERSRLQLDLNTSNDRLTVANRTLAPPLISRETDAFVQRSLNYDAMGAAAIDLLKRQVKELAFGGDNLEEKLLTLHSCLCAKAARAALALDEVANLAASLDISLPERPRMVVSESMAREHLEAHTGYIETAIELAEKALIARGDTLGRGRGRPAGSKNKTRKSS